MSHKAALMFATVLVLQGCSKRGTFPKVADTLPPHASGLPPTRISGESDLRYFARIGMNISDGDVEAHIDPEIRGESRDKIRAIMLSLPPYARENVVYIDRSGRTLANKLQLVTATDIYAPVSRHSGMFRDRSGREMAAPPFTAKPLLNATVLSRPMYGTPPAFPANGPYRRVYSDPNTWDSGGMHVMFASHATSIHGLSTASKGPWGDIGFMYSGGWSSSGADAADAGLQYSAARNQADVFLSILSTHTGIVTTAGNFAPQYDDEVDFLIGCGPQYQCNSGLPGNNLAAFVWGTFTNGKYGGVTLAQPPTNINDWRGNSTVLKDMISIGQSNPPNGIAYDGYAFAWIAANYCGWQGPHFNLCYLPPFHRNGYHMEHFVPNQSVVQSIAAPNGYNEMIGITLSTAYSN